MDDRFSDNKKTFSFSSSIGGGKQNEEKANMKEKFFEAWNNFRFELSDSGNNLNKDSPLWILGKCYHVQPIQESPVLQTTGMNKEKSSKEDKTSHYQEFLLDFSSILWFTYRKGFPPLVGTTLTSDTGWGCMIRTGQMMIGQCLLIHFLGRNWSWLSMKPEDLNEKKCHRDVIQMFIDEPNPRCPFSIHRLTEIGLNYRCRPGDWYGPGTVAYILQDASECGKGSNPLLNELVIYVAQDCTVYTKDIRDVCQWGKCSNTTNTDNAALEPISRSVVVLVPVRLGEAAFNPIYIPCLQELLKQDYSIGIIGGRPKHSLYFVGFQDEYLIYLDPHYCQQSDTLATFSNKQLKSYHSPAPRKMHISKLDPSCCLGFYCRDEDQFKSFSEQVAKLLSPPKQKTSYPLCLILDGSINDYKVRLPTKQDVPANQTSCSSDTEHPATNDATFNEERTSRDTPIWKFGKRTSIAAATCASSSGTTSATKSEKFNFSITKPKELFTNFYRQRSRSPKHSKNEISLEEEFEIL